MKKPIQLLLTQGKNEITFYLNLDERKDRSFIELTDEFAYRSGITLTRIPPECQEEEDE